MDENETVQPRRYPGTFKSTIMPKTAFGSRKPTINTNSLRELQLEKANHVPNYSTAKMKDFNNMKSFLKNAKRVGGKSVNWLPTEEDEKPTTLVIEDSGVMDSDSDDLLEEEDGFVVTQSNFMKTQAKFT